jgi:anti-sigma regulatory factor (Ser/Thr protein kinase)
MPTFRRRRFPPTAASVRAARAYTTAALRDGNADGAAIDDVELIVSELATNAVQHAGTTFEVVVETDGRIRVDVTDESPLLPIPRSVAPTATSGRGVRVVDALCDRWGVEVHDDYKRVWCERDRRRPQ